MHTEILTPEDWRIRDAERLMRISIKQEEAERNYLALMRDIQRHDGPEFDVLYSKVKALYMASKNLREEMQKEWRQMLGIQSICVP